MQKLCLIKINLQKDMEQLLKLRIQKMMHIYEAAKLPVIADWDEKLNSITGGRKGYIMISFLRSSYITGSHSFRVAFYEKGLFIEENPAAFSYNMTPFLEGVEKDVECLWKKAEKEFIQVFSWRKEELRRFYMEKVYKESVIIFQNMINEMKKTEEIEIFYGEEMGHVEQIGMTGGGE